MKIYLTLVAVASIISGAWIYSSSQPVSEPQFGALQTFTSKQLAASPSNGDCLTTDGSANIWDTCAAGPGGDAADGLATTSLAATYPIIRTLSASAVTFSSAVSTTTVQVCASGCSFTSINAATALGFRSISVAPGTYSLSAPILLYDDLVIYGNGALMQFNRSSVRLGMISNDLSTDTENVKIYDLSLQATGASTGGTCFDFTNIVKSKFDGLNCYTAQRGFIASTTASGYYNKFDHYDMSIDGGYGASTSSCGFCLQDNSSIKTEIGSGRIRPISTMSSSTCYYIDSHDVHIDGGECETDALYGLYVTKFGSRFWGLLYLEGNQTNALFEKSASGVGGYWLGGNIADADTDAQNVIDQGAVGLRVDVTNQYDGGSNYLMADFGIGTTTVSGGVELGVQGNMFIAGQITSTSTLTSVFPYASSTAITATTLYATNATTTALSVTNLQNCNTVDTDGSGNLKCGTDADSGGAAGVGQTFELTPTNPLMLAPTTTQKGLILGERKEATASYCLLCLHATTTASAQRLISATSSSGFNGRWINFNDSSSDVFYVGNDGAVTSGSVVTGTTLTSTGGGVVVGNEGVNLTGGSGVNDGKVTIQGRGTGSDEDLTLDFDTTANTVVITSSTGVTDIDWSAIQRHTLPYASTTALTVTGGIGDNTRTGGLTIYGSATSTFAGTASIHNWFTVFNTGTQAAQEAGISLGGYQGNVFHQIISKLNTGGATGDLIFRNGKGTLSELARFMGATGYFGIATTSPAATLAVGGDIFAGRYTATSTQASVFPYASSTAITAASALYVGSDNKQTFSTFAFSYGSSTQGSGTTTRYLAPSPAAITVNTVQCDFNAWMQISLYDGTNRANYLIASSTIGTFTYTSNNTFTSGETMRVDISTSTNPGYNVVGGCRFKYVAS